MGDSARLRRRPTACSRGSVAFELRSPATAFGALPPAVAPCGDIAWNVEGASSDLHYAGVDGLILQGLALALVGVVGVVGFFVQWGLWGERAASLAGYVIGLTVWSAAFGLCAALGMALFAM